MSWIDVTEIDACIRLEDEGWDGTANNVRRMARALRDAEAALKRAFDVAAEAKDRTSSSIAVVNFTTIRDITGQALDDIAHGGDEQIELCRRCGKTGWHVCVDRKIAAPSAEKTK